MLFLSSSLLLLMQLAVTTVASVQRISIHQLQEPTVKLHNILHESGGAIRISVNHPTNDDGNSTINANDPSDDSLMYNVVNLRKEALTAMCTCPAFQKSASFPTNDRFKQLLESHPNDVQHIDLPDGSIRRTLATATIGFDGESSHPLPIPSWFERKCGHRAYDSLENLRDAVARVVDLFIGKLDSEKEREQSYRQTLQSANHLEHFHVYFKEWDEQNEETPVIEGSQMIETNEHLITSTKAGARKTQTKATTLGYHTDAGFFLSFVPALNCHSDSVDDSSFYIKLEDEPIKFEEDEVVILMGAGAQYWMNENLDNGAEDDSAFVAAPHALRLLPNAHRAWYGKMHLLPFSLTSNAFSAGTSVGHASSSSVRYGDVLPTFQLENYKAYVPPTMVDGCGIIPLDAKLVSSVPFAQTNRRRLQHVGSPANCNNETSFFCWYQCVSIPDSDHALDYLRDGHSLYCLDPSMLSDNSVADAAAPCKNGFTHNSACSGSWQLTDESLPGYEFPNYAAVLEEEKAAAAALEEEATAQTAATAVEAENAAAAAATYPAPDTGDQYCYGGTSMYMDGFNWRGTTCVIYLFPSWILSSSGKFAVACIGSILFGVLLEYVLWKRRSVYTMKPGMQRLTISVMVYGLQLTMGYFVMLIVMTYSGPLFVSTVGGMMLGHGLFNAEDGYVKRTAEQQAGIDGQETGAGTGKIGSTELASTYQNVGSRSQNSSEVDEDNGLGSKTSNGTRFAPTEKTKLKESIADGVTPCCQYTV